MATKKKPAAKARAKAKKPSYSKAVEAALADLVIANRILANERVIDAFGHCSIRHPERPDRYFLARSRSPELVERGDLFEFDLDSNPIHPDGRTLYSERPIHGCIYKARPDVNSVCHNHAHSLIPFGVTNTEIKPIWHVAGCIGAHVPNWDIRDDFGETDLLVTNNEQGASLAKKLGKNRTALMRGHGAVVTSHDLKSCVFTAIYLMANAEL
ncbi:MAG: class II aldolase/adducin family protein, partial [Rhodospirillaceae bacterium]|nr:class II aldolase/adducin family protein [Rhodospirillaceae bacterium]